MNGKTKKYNWILHLSADYDFPDIKDKKKPGTNAPGFPIKKLKLIIDLNHINIVFDLFNLSGSIKTLQRVLFRKSYLFTQGVLWNRI